MNSHEPTPYWMTNLICAQWLPAYLSKGNQSFAIQEVHSQIGSWSQRWEIDEPSTDQVRRVADLCIERFAPVVQHRQLVSPLSKDWPKGTDQAYLMSLMRLPVEYGYVNEYPDDPWWLDEVNAALELRESFAWPGCFDEHGESREPWFLADPYGLHRRIPGELAIIKELAIRRRLEEHGLLDTKVGFRDIFRILAERPWTGPQGHRKHIPEFDTPSWSPTLLEGLGPYSTLETKDAVGHLRNAFPLLTSPQGYHTSLSPGVPVGHKQMIRGVVEAYHRVKEVVSALCPIDSIMSLPVFGLGEVGDEEIESCRHEFIGMSPLAHTWARATEAWEMSQWLVDHRLNIDVPLTSGATLRDILDSVHRYSVCESSSIQCADMKRLMKMHPGPQRSTTPNAGRNGYLDAGLGIWCGKCDRWSLDGIESAPYSPWIAGLFIVYLQSCGPNRIDVIKAIREITSLSLQEAKKLAEEAPTEVKTCYSAQEASKIKFSLEDCGATAIVHREW